MSVETIIEVPTILDGPDEERAFRVQLSSALQQGALLVLDTRAQPALSGITLGCIMYHLGGRRGQMAFINVSNYLFHTLRTIVGPAAYQFVRGPITNLDDYATVSRP